MRSVLYIFFVIAIGLALFVPAFRVLRTQPPPDRFYITFYIDAELESGKAHGEIMLMNPAHIERFRQWRFKPGEVNYVPPRAVVPPPPNYEWSGWSKSVS
jgi:hypothetical protein